jgi:hypothetical protein
VAIVGIVKCFFGGTDIPLMPGSTFDRGGIVNDPKVVGITVKRARKMKETAVKLKVALGDGDSLDTWFPPDVEQEFQFETDTGQTYTMENAFVSDSQTINDGGAGVDVSIAGGTATEVVSTSA